MVSEVGVWGGDDTAFDEESRTPHRQIPLNPETKIQERGKGQSGQNGVSPCSFVLQRVCMCVTSCVVGGEAAGRGANSVKGEAGPHPLTCPVTQGIQQCTLQDARLDATHTHTRAWGGLGPVQG
eukprot:TRINITY_DN12951_c1_g1_i3.p1 TRINITY_DN12951_c1_g1~~TRINITY_DN12951_c1_g1_i3.p1  ORF type:complete len:124 (-),score=4.33 TRINITY_DN12951_c1_g1_i3:75-446(-)